MLSKKIMVIGLLAFFIFPSTILDTTIPNVQAEFPKCTQFDETVIYKIGVIIIDIGDIDLKTGTYNVTFWIFISSDQVNVEDYPLKIDFVNGKSVETVFEKITPDTHYLKINGDFFNDMNFNNYPFSTIELAIEIESAECETEFLKFVADESLNYVDSNIYVPGWHLDGFDVKVEEHSYPGIGEFGRFIMAATISTPFLSSFLQLVLPITVLITLSLITFKIDVEQYIDKIGVISGLLVATIFFHVFIVLENLPSLEYLTLQDKMIFVIYVIMFYTIIETSLQRTLNEKGDKKIAETINKKMRYTLPIAIAGFLAILWIFG